MQDLLCVDLGPTPVADGRGRRQPGRASWLDAGGQASTARGATSRSDNVGLGLENFDAVGQFRARYAPADFLDIDPTGTLPDGTLFMGLSSLADLLQRDPRFLDCAARKALVYALGRPLVAADDAPVAQLRAAWIAAASRCAGCWARSSSTTSFAFAEERAHEPDPSRDLARRGRGAGAAAHGVARARGARARRPGGAHESGARFVAMTFPNGATTAFWKPHGLGVGSAWELSPVLAPLAPVKRAVSVLNNVGNYGPFNGHVEPSHANLFASFLTCAKPKTAYDGTSPSVTVGISVDQVIAAGIGAATKIPSLQVGLSTLDSYTDGLPGPCSRSISWDATGQPLGKVIDPQAVFDRLVAAGPVPSPTLGPDPAAAARRAANKSVLDYVLGHAATVQAKLGRSDRARLDQFLTSVRELETSLQQGTVGPSCSIPVRSADSYAVGNVPHDYDRNVHANQMIDPCVMALQCDLTRVVSFALDDARSDFVYDFLTVRNFTTAGSTPGTMLDSGAHGVSSAGDNKRGCSPLGRPRELRPASPRSRSRRRTGAVLLRGPQRRAPRRREPSAPPWRAPRHSRVSCQPGLANGAGAATLGPAGAQGRALGSRAGVSVRSSTARWPAAAATGRREPARPVRRPSERHRAAERRRCRGTASRR